MGILSAFGDWFGLAPKATNPGPLDNFWYTGTPHLVGRPLTPDNAMRATAVYACVRLIADTIASMPFNIYRRVDDDGKELATDHYLYELLRFQPNQTQTAFEFWEEAIAHLKLRGAFYAEIKLGRGKKIIDELVPLHPDRVKPIRMTDNSVRYEYTPIGQERNKLFRKDELFRIQLFTGPDGITPISPIAYNSDTLQINESAEKYARAFFDNGSAAGVVLQTDGIMKPEDKQATIASWKRAHMGPDNAFKVAVLDHSLKYQAIGITNEDAQLLDARKYQVTDIARIFRVPLHLIQSLDRATFNNIEHQTTDFAVHTIRPICRRIQNAVQRDLLVGDEKRNIFGEFLFAELMSADTKTRGQFYNLMIQNGIMTRNEVRKRENLNPLDGLDEPMQPLNMVTQDEKDAQLELDNDNNQDKDEDK